MADRPIAPVLNLQTVRQRQFIRIDGVSYDLRQKGDLSIADNVFLEDALPELGDQIAIVKARAVAHGEQDEACVAAEARASDLMQAIVRIAVAAPPRVLAKLHNVQRLAVCSTFLTAPRTNKSATATPTPARAAARPTARLNGASSAAASRASMAGRRTAGSGGRPSTS